MKKLLLILLCLPMIGFGQNLDELFSKAQNYYLNGEYLESIIYYTEAIVLFPDYPNLYYNRAYSYVKLEKYLDAVPDFSKAISLNSKFTEAYKERGRTSLLMVDAWGEIDKEKTEILLDMATKDFNKAIELEPSNADLYKNRATLKSRYLKDYKGAITDFNIAIAFNPNLAKAWNDRGYCKFLLNIDEYCDDFQNACKLKYCIGYNKFCK
jgi:tetratricopeptide (TPR) repeat protein